jgi:glycine/D-amino acid oxidase-like deaminating enzyme
MTNQEAHQKQIDIDVLIIGGGIQGLWLLNDLTQVGYNVALLENGKLGGDQTLHSHGFLHQGYGYTNAEMARRLKVTTERWNVFIKKRCIPIPQAPSLYGFTSLANSLLWRGKWAEAGLEAREYQRLPFMEKGLLRKVFETDEKWLNTAGVIKCLAAPVEQAIIQGEVERFRYSPDKDVIESVDVIVDNQRFLFACKFVVLAAGKGNHQLLRMVNSAYIQNKAERVKQLRKSLMLVIKGNSQLLDIALVVPDLWLFIVSRRDKNGDNIWLASYDVDQAYDEKQNIEPDQSRVQDTTTALFTILPRLFARQNVRKMQWGAYTGLKAEARNIDITTKVETGQVLTPHEWVIETFAKNIYAVWPTKLTLAPEASKALVFRLLDLYVPPLQKFIPEKYDLPKIALQFGQEKWQETDLLSWEDFKIKYNIKTRVDE